MDPITLGLMLGGGAISGFGRIFGGMAEARVRNENAAIQDHQADLRIQKGEFDAAQAERRFERQQGEVVAQAGKSGVDAASFYDVLNDDASEAALEREAIRYTARNEAFQLRRQARSQRRAGQDAIIGGFISGAGEVVSSLGRARRYSTSGTSAYNPFEE